MWKGREEYDSSGLMEKLYVAELIHLSIYSTLGETIILII